jgi:N-acylneuraminate cytidylyltransferase
MAEGHCAIIPARKGSKSILNKNLIRFGGESLIRITLRQALESGIFNTIVITTDYERRELDISDIESTRFTKIYIVKRPQLHAGDKAKMIGVVKHALSNIPNNFQWAWILQPTSPFRSKMDFLNIRDKLVGDTTGVISMKPAKESPNRMYSFKDRRFYRTKHGNFNNKQDLKPMFERSGNFYVAKRLRFQRAKEMEDVFDSRFEGHLMGGCTLEDLSHNGAFKNQAIWERCRAYGSNIDGPEDLVLARDYYKKGTVKL